MSNGKGTLLGFDAFFAPSRLAARAAFSPEASFWSKLISACARWVEGERFVARS
jgi:hypothetical protein